MADADERELELKIQALKEVKQRLAQNRAVEAISTTHAATPTPQPIPTTTTTNTATATDIYQQHNNDDNKDNIDTCCDNSEDGNTTCTTVSDQAPSTSPRLSNKVLLKREALRRSTSKGKLSRPPPRPSSDAPPVPTRANSVPTFFLTTPTDTSATTTVTPTTIECPQEKGGVSESNWEGKAPGSKMGNKTFVRIFDNPAMPAQNNLEEWMRVQEEERLREKEKAEAERLANTGGLLWDGRKPSDKMGTHTFVSIFSRDYQLEPTSPSSQQPQQPQQPDSPPQPLHSSDGLLTIEDVKRLTRRPPPSADESDDPLAKFRLKQAIPTGSQGSPPILKTRMRLSSRSSSSPNLLTPTAAATYTRDNPSKPLYTPRMPTVKSQPVLIRAPIPTSSLTAGLAVPSHPSHPTPAPTPTTRVSNPISIPTVTTTPTTFITQMENKAPADTDPLADSHEDDLKLSIAVMELLREQQESKRGLTASKKEELLAQLVEEMERARAHKVWVQMQIDALKDSPVIATGTSPPSLVRQNSKNRGLLRRELWRIAWNELQVETQTIGQGSYGQIMKGKYLGTPVAIKKLKLPEGEDADFMQVFLDREVAVLKGVRHPNIMQLMGVCTHEDNTYLVTEYIEQGNLMQLIKESNKPISWRSKVQMLKDIASALLYLHAKSIMHRDVKSENILVSSKFGVKLADFGLARKWGKNARRRLTICGTEAWAAPELMQGGAYDFKADIFSLGVVLWELITRVDAATYSRTTGQTYAIDLQRLASITPEDTPLELVEIAKLCIATIPERRPNAEEVLVILNEIEASLPADEALMQSLTEQLLFFAEQTRNLQNALTATENERNSLRKQVEELQAQLRQV